MTDKQIIQDIVQRKAERQATLRGLKHNLIELDTELYGSKFSRFFGTSYWFIKRWLTLLLGITIFIIGIALFISPSYFYQQMGVASNDLRHEYEVEFMTKSEKNLTALVENLAQHETLTVDNALDAASSTFDSMITEQIQTDLQGFGIFLGLLALFVLYISRQAQKVLIRNRKISESETVTQDVGKTFQAVIDQEEEELDRLKKLLVEN